MPRIRTIKPTFWKDQKLGKLKRDVRLMYIGLWNLADDEGIVHGDAAIIKSELFPFDEDLRSGIINEWIGQLTKARMIIPFTFNCESYYLVRTFKAHQTINKPQPSKIPKGILDEVIEHSRSDTEELTEHSGNDTVAFHTGREGNGRERKGVERGEPETPPPKEKKTIPHLFKNSRFLEKEIFAAAISETKYSEADSDYYHDLILNWSDSKDAKKSDWLATAKNWMAKDITEGKFITKDFKPPKNGHTKNHGKAAGVISTLAKLNELSEAINRR